MKLTTGLLLMIGLFLSSVTMAQVHKPKPKPMHPPKPMKIYTKNDYKIISHNMINKNIPILQRAQAALNIGKNYTGDFSKAVQHQRKAREMYRKGLYDKAAYHAKAARGRAISSIKANKGVVDKEWNYSKEEADSTKNAPSKEELEKELPKESASDEKMSKVKIEELGVE